MTTQTSDLTKTIASRDAKDFSPKPGCNSEFYCIATKGRSHTEDVSCSAQKRKPERNSMDDASLPARLPTSSVRVTLNECSDK